jgi:beta-glucanase (GH16 family)
MNQTHIGSRNVPYLKQSFAPDDFFVEYKCKWEPDKITFYVNDTVVREVTGYVCQQLTKNIENPEKGFKMNAIFNVWVENPDKYKIELTQPMYIRNFKYIPL